ncbi:hypothetical protein PT974_08198 [Cladobotryum mycophilum]|uniref:Uncharacterized protein n=1 Tax=Cladobotryum mycophilum TaxID=491253 RepID=A0ABR0SCQ5_9HYPO
MQSKSKSKCQFARVNRARSHRLPDPRGFGVMPNEMEDDGDAGLSKRVDSPFAICERNWLSRASI